MLDRQGLRRQIDAAKGRYREAGGADRVEAEVDLWPDTMLTLHRLLGRVNRTEFCGADPGTLMFYSFDINNGAAKGHFLLILFGRWNEWLDRDGHWRRCEPAPFEAADFEAI